MFKLDSRLRNDTIFFDSLNFSDLLLMNDRKYPWFILVPRKDGVFDFIDLPFEDQVKFLEEINYVANFLKTNFNPHKINIASLGNVVKQLHVHIVARFSDDESFPAPVWCNNKVVIYEESEIDNLKNRYHDYK